MVSVLPFFQVYESAGHTLPRAMQNVSNNVYNEDKGDRWDITRFWNEAIFTDIAECWRFACEVRQIVLTTHNLKYRNIYIFYDCEWSSL